jgi:glycosyltransferase involved in cell wall biosynthesis
MENGVVNLCNRLESDLFSSTICVLEGGGAMENRVDRNRVDIVHVHRYIGNDPTVPIRLGWLLRRRRIDVVHSHNWVTLVEGFTAAKLASVSKVIHGEHGYPIEDRKRNIHVQRYVWGRVSQLTAVSHSLADDIAAVNEFPRQRIAVIPNGVDTSAFRPSQAGRCEIREKLGISRNDLLIGMIARLDPIKNHAGVIRVFSSLVHKGLGAFLALVGDGTERNALERLAVELGVSHRVPSHFRRRSLRRQSAA